jgi:hypothetical protein
MIKNKVTIPQINNGKLRLKPDCAQPKKEPTGSMNSIGTAKESSIVIPKKKKLQKVYFDSVYIDSRPDISFNSIPPIYFQLIKLYNFL